MHYALQREFEPDVSAFIRRAVQPGMVVFDIGANIGQFTLLAAKRVGASGRVHAFEPAPEEYRKLCANVALNRFENVVLNALAVSDTVGEATLQVCGKGLGAYNSLGRPFREGPVTPVNVSCTTLDDYTRSAGLTHVDLIKMDIEGAELATLRGASELLSGPDAPTLVCEFSEMAAEGMGHSTRELRRHLEDLGYRIQRYDLGTHTLAPEPPRERYDYDNLICSRREVVLHSSLQS